MAVRVQRFDKGELSKAERTSAGYLRAPAIATRTGVFTYRLPDGTVRRELRHPEDVFAPASLATLAGVPVTDDHPNVKNPNVLLLTPENTSEYMRGFTGDNVGKDGKFVTAVATITDADLIAQVLDGKKSEVSCGYTCDHEEKPGEYEGQPYDIRQRNITYNHFAVVARGRAGHDVRIKLDAACAVQVDESDKPLEDKRMEKITLGGVDYDCTPEMKAAIMAAVAEAGKAKVDDKGGDTSNAVTSGNPPPPADPAMQAKNDALQARLDAATAEVSRLKGSSAAAAAAAANDAKVREAVKTRMRLELVAQRILSKEELTKLDSMDDKAIKAAVVKAERKGINLDGKSDAYIDASFDLIAEGLAASGKDPGVAGARHDRADDDAKATSDDARKRAMERTMERSHRRAGEAAPAKKA